MTRTTDRHVSHTVQQLPTMADDYHTTNILRLSGELCIKSPTVRRRFQDRLAHNIRHGLDGAGVDYTLHRHWSRFDVETDDPGAPKLLKRIFGVVGVTPAQVFRWKSLAGIVERAGAYFQQRVAGHTFAVRARRVGNRDPIPFESGDLNRQLGTRLLEASAGVDLDDPEVTVGLEVRAKEVFLLGEELQAPAGLPMGTEGKALALVSGGFDSAVAAWMMQKRGMDLDFLFFNLGGPAHERDVRDVTKRLCEQWSHGYSPDFHVVDLRAMVAQMKQRVAGSYWQLLLKRLMVRAAHMICVDNGYPAMITGESAGQVSSQTLLNLAAIQTPIRTPILRPLVGLNKDDIVELARRVGTYEMSAQAPEFCALDGGRPVTNGSCKRLDREESKLSDRLLATLIDQRDVRVVADMAGGGELIDVETDQVPDGAVVVDIRTGVKKDDWRYPDSVDIPFEKALGNVAYLPEDATYLLCCEVGLKSAFLAERMRRMNFDAYSFRGGMAALKKSIEPANQASQSQPA